MSNKNRIKTYHKRRTTSIQKVSHQQEWKRQYDEYSNNDGRMISGNKMILAYNHWDEIKKKKISQLIDQTKYQKLVLKRFNKGWIARKVNSYRLQQEFKFENRNKLPSPYLIVEHAVCGYIRINVFLYIPYEIKQMICCWLLPADFSKNNYKIISKDVDELIYPVWNSKTPLYNFDMNVFNPFKLELDTKLIGHTTSITNINALGTSTDGLLYTSSRDKSIIIWQLCEKQFIDYQEMFREFELDTSYQPEHKVFIDGFVKKQFYAHDHIVTDMDVCLNRKYIVSCSHKNIRLWTTKGIMIHSVDVNFANNYIKHIRIITNPKKKINIITVTQNGCISLWRVHKNKLIKERDLRKGNDSRCITHISNDYNCIDNPAESIIISINDIIYLYETISYQLKGKLIKHNCNINSLSISSDNSCLASADNNNIIMFWNIKEMKYIFQEMADFKINDLKFATIGNLMCIVVAHDKHLTVFDISTKEAIFSTARSPIDDHATKTNWNKYLLCDGTLIQKQRKRKRHNKSRNKTKIKCIDWSMDAQKLYVGFSNGIINVCSFTESMDFENW